MKRYHSKTEVYSIIFGIIVCALFWGSAIYFYLSRYYFFNRHNIYAQRAVVDILERRYDQEFDLLEIKFQRWSDPSKEGRMINRWTFLLSDNEGRLCYSYLWMYGVGPVAGNPVEIEYHMRITDSYEQLRVEEYLEDEFCLSQYRQQIPDKYEDWVDYVFIYTENNSDEIAEILTKVYFTEPEYSRYGRLKCRVSNEDGEEVFWYDRIKIRDKLQNEGIEITQETIYEYIIQELQKDMTVNSF